MSVQLPTASFSQIAVMGAPTLTTVDPSGEVGLGAAWTAEKAARAERAKAASIVKEDGRRQERGKGRKA